MAVQYRRLDLTAYPRREHFEYFHSMANPYVGLTVPVDITAFLTAVKTAKKPFFLSFLYCLGSAANAVPELRRRILDGGIIEVDTCDASYTVMQENGAYGYGRVAFGMPFDEYLATAIPQHERAKAHATIEIDEDELSYLFVSSVPWLSYTALQQPTPVPADSNPRLTFGKYETENGRTRIPVTLLANHALVDGLHIAQFYANLDSCLSAVTQELSAQ